MTDARQKLRLSLPIKNSFASDTSRSEIKDSEDVREDTGSSLSLRPITSFANRPRLIKDVSNNINPPIPNESATNISKSQLGLRLNIKLPQRKASRDNTQISNSVKESAADRGSSLDLNIQDNDRSPKRFAEVPQSPIIIEGKILFPGFSTLELSDLGLTKLPSQLSLFKYAQVHNS